jgi:hypothetical protein
VGKNSRERHKAKRRAAESAQRRRPTQPPDAGHPFGIFGRPEPPSHQQLAEQIIVQSLHARHRGEQAEVDRCHRLLVDGPGGASGIQVVNRALFTMLLRKVEEAWVRGWQPSELVRVTRRELAVPHGRIMVDAIAGQMRGYAAATVDPRWRSQVAAVDAQVWWQHDDHYVTAWGERHGTDRGAVIDNILDLLQLLLTLPEIEVVGARPGAFRPASVAVAADIDQRLLDRVRALLAKAESTEFAEEAEAFTAKAQELMTRHRIDHALLAATTGRRDDPATRRVSIDNPYEAPKSLLLQVVAQANGCRSAWTKQFGFTTIVGFPADLDSTELLFTSLLVQGTRAMTQSRPGPDRWGRNTTRSFRQSFLTAYASRIGERLTGVAGRVDREVAESAGGADLLPVLAARDGAVRDAFERLFPAVTQRAQSINNGEGWASGRAAADRASLHGRQAVSG